MLGLDFGISSRQIDDAVGDRGDLEGGHLRRTGKLDHDHAINRVRPLFGQAEHNLIRRWLLIHGDFLGRLAHQIGLGHRCFQPRQRQLAIGGPIEHVHVQAVALCVTRPKNFSRLNGLGPLP